jgi:arginase
MKDFMYKPHFFKLHSRIGLKFFPKGSTELNLGVEDGPDAVLTSDFLEKFSYHQTHSYAFPAPDSLSDDDYCPGVANYSNQAAQLINQELQDNEVQVTIGGDHSTAFVSLLSVLNRYEASDVGVVMFDSHGDLHLTGTSPSGNFHGMWLRPLLDKIDVDEIEGLVPNKIPNSNLMFIGNLDLEDEEQNYVEKHQIEIISSEEINKDQGLLEKSQQRFEEFLKSFRHVHISFDIDVFNQSLVSATGTPNPQGLDKEVVFEMLKVVKNVCGGVFTTQPKPNGKLESYSLDLVEVNPQKSGANETTALAQEVLFAILH